MCVSVSTAAGAARERGGEREKKREGEREIERESDKERMNEEIKRLPKSGGTLIINNKQKHKQSEKREDSK